MYIAGIDEAGRGPVIGPMVIAGIKIENERIRELEELGVKDSKLLSPEEREEIYENIVKVVDHYFEVISPKIIDLYVIKNQLNLLEIKYMIKIIEKLDPDVVYIDSPSNNASRVKQFIMSKLGKKIKLIVEPKADKKYPVVSAASIIAKVIRDKEIEKIKEKIGIDFGSGYPSDPRTIEFLKKYGNEYKEYIRESWMTYKKICMWRTQSKLNQFFNFD